MLQFIYIWIDNKNNFTVCHKWKPHQIIPLIEVLKLCLWLQSDLIKKKLHILSYYITQKFDAT